MRSTPDVFPPADSGLGDLVLLSANGEPETFDLDLGEEGDARLELAARDDDDAPYGLRVMHGEAPMHTRSVAESFFAPGVERDRFTTVTGRRLAGVVGVDEATATTAIGTVLEEVGDRFGADAVHTIDGEARKLLDKTAAVTYSPNGNGDLVVTFDDVDFSGNDFAYYRSQMTIPARQWVDTSSAPNLRVEEVRQAFNGAEGRARWETVRRIWMAMATDGDVPPTEMPVTADDLRERGTVPKIGVSVDAVREAVQSHRRFDDVRDELGVSRPRQKVLGTAIEKLDLADNVEYGMVRP